MNLQPECFPEILGTKERGLKITRTALAASTRTGCNTCAIIQRATNIALPLLSTFLPFVTVQIVGEDSSFKISGTTSLCFSADECGAQLYTLPKSVFFALAFDI
jgi:hypothetical protein